MIYQRKRKTPNKYWKSGFDELSRMWLFGIRGRKLQQHSVRPNRMHGSFQRVYQLVLLPFRRRSYELFQKDGPDADQKCSHFDGGRAGSSERLWTAVSSSFLLLSVFVDFRSECVMLISDANQNSVQFLVSRFVLDRQKVTLLSLSIFVAWLYRNALKWHVSKLFTLCRFVCFIMFSSSYVHNNCLFGQFLTTCTQTTGDISRCRICSY